LNGTLDPAALQVLISRLTGVAEEMGDVLRRAAFSPNIKERADCSAALFTASGELLVQAEHIPVHLGSMPASVRAAIDAARTWPPLVAGDQVILNDPFAGGTHLNDITLVAPCFVDGALVGWAANRAHHADVGGMAPGSIPPEATEIQQEGFRMPPVRLTADVVALLCANSRTPAERRGDLDAQVGANAVGVARLASFDASAFEEVLSYGERRMRAALLAVPDGVYGFSDVLDSSGPFEHQRSPVDVVVAVTVAGDSVTFDFTGSGAQTSGNVNAVLAVTESCVSFALRSALDPTLPSNAGAMRPVRVVAPSGSVVAASSPAAVGAGNVEVSQRVADVCLGALSVAMPDRVGAASQGTMNNLIIGGTGWVYYETVAGGQGGRPSGVGGMSGVHTGMTNTLNTPTEALERAFPMRVLKYRLRSGSGGAGSSPGGDGIERDLLMLEDVTVSLITERRSSQPWGLAGGSPGAVGENWLLPGGEEAKARRLLDKCTVRLKAGDVLRMLTPGGGGWGRPGDVVVDEPLPAGSAQPSVVVRDAVEDDLASITALFNALIPTTTVAWREVVADTAEMAEWFASQRAEGHPVLVAQVEGAVAGYTTWGRFRGGPRFPGYRHTVELTIHVDGARHGQGVGRALLDALVELARQRGVHVLVAGIDRDNSASIAFHASLGFVEVARMPEVGRKFDRWLDLVLMQRVIADGERA
jgi:N-methylhydantoinase B/oxoprolinase/acetone carboxylase alpha subunit/L-amino acid N-acyltransferase YncA